MLVSGRVQPQKSLDVHVPFSSFYLSFMGYKKDHRFCTWWWYSKHLQYSRRRSAISRSFFLTASTVSGQRSEHLELGGETAICKVGLISTHWNSEFCWSESLDFASEKNGGNMGKMWVALITSCQHHLRKGRVKRKLQSLFPWMLVL